MNSQIETKVIAIANELQEKKLMHSNRKIESTKIDDISFKAGIFFSNIIIFNPERIKNLNDDMIRFGLLHEEGHLQQTQYGTPAIIGLNLLVIAPMVYYSITSGFNLLITGAFVIIVFLASFRILRKPLYRDEFGSDEFACRILRDHYNVKKPSEILINTFNSISPNPNLPEFVRKIYFLFLEYHPSDEDRRRNIAEFIDEK